MTLQLISTLNHDANTILTNIMRKGTFYSVQEIEAMGDPDSPLVPADVEAAFGNGDILSPEIISSIQEAIDKVFVENLMKDDKPIGKFGSRAESYTNAIDKYKVAVLNAILEWQGKYEDENGPLGAELRGRAAYAL